MDKEGSSVFIPITVLVLLVVCAHAAVRFYIQKDFKVEIQNTCNGEENCEMVECDDIYAALFQCTVGDTVSVSAKTVSGKSFTDCVYRGQCSL